MFFFFFVFIFSHGEFIYGATLKPQGQTFVQANKCMRQHQLHNRTLNVNAASMWFALLALFSHNRTLKGCRNEWKRKANQEKYE